MLQIYYTQCPIGYGLGASNGFQIKRLTPGYPLSGDFRHLGFRAFLAGTRMLAPSALRFRRDEGGRAEIAWLSPRTHEYETERGLWGRPGGHFAHGVQLDDDELNSIGDWPAGLYDQPFWTRTDPIPSRGQPPRSLAISREQLRWPPSFEAMVTLAEVADVETLAQLLSALVTATREGRTLFLIDEPLRLAAEVALLTLALPVPWRGALTFSTYHDRPEELPGFRLQGTTPAARPNRAALLALGIVADLAQRTCAPACRAPVWATILARWLVRRSDADRLAWEATGRRASLAAANETFATLWSDDWLDCLYGFDSLVREPPRFPGAASDWEVLTGTALWAARAGVAAEWLSARPPEWWDAAATAGPEPWRAFVTQLGLADAWGGEARAAWGKTAASWLRGRAANERFQGLGAVLDAAPVDARPAFLRGVIAGLPDSEVAATLRWLKGRPSCDRALLLPLEVGGAVSEATVRRHTKPLVVVLTEALALPVALREVLDALSAEVGTRPDSLAAVADALATTLEAADPRAVPRVVRWALRKGDRAATWLGPYLHRMFADPMNHDAWTAFCDHVPVPLRGVLARVVLATTRDATLPDEPFRWGVEEVLLALPDAERPHDPTWAGSYLDRTPSGLDLLKRLYTKDDRRPGLRRWLEAAHERGELSLEQRERLVACQHYARALRSGDARSLLDIRLPAVPAEERGALLGQILGHHLGRAGDDDDTLALALDTCRHAWPGGFSAGAPGLGGLGRALAVPLLGLRGEPREWFDRLLAILDRLRLEGSATDAFAPLGLASAIVAETTRRDAAVFVPWPLRQHLLLDDTAWRCLSLDIRQDLDGQSSAGRLATLEHWDRSLAKGLHTARFFEVWLNSCDRVALADAVAARAEDLRSLGTLSWWDADRHADARDDLRDAFARGVPMAPVPEPKLAAIRGWIGRDDRGGPSLSPIGRSRWRCVEALSTFSSSGHDTEECWQVQAGWRHDLPLSALEEHDRYQFLAWLILRVEQFQTYQVARLAMWLWESGVTDVDRINRWADALEGLAPVAPATRLARVAMVAELRVELKTLNRESRERPAKSRHGDSP